MASNDDDPFGLDELARRAVEVMFGLLGRAQSLARAVLIFAVVACCGAWLLGVAALDGTGRFVWIAIGSFFAFVAIAAVGLATFRLAIVRRGGDALVGEVRTLIGNDESSERTVIETVESAEGAGGDGVVNMSKQFFSLRDEVTGHATQFAALPLAVSSITTFPGLVALATVISMGMLGLGAIFALILIF